MQSGSTDEIIDEWENDDSEPPDWFVLLYFLPFLLGLGALLAKWLF